MTPVNMMRVDDFPVLLSVLAVVITNNIKVLCVSEWCGDYADTTRGLIYSASHINQSNETSETFLTGFSIINGVLINGVEYLTVSKLHINVTSGRISAHERDTSANYHHLLRSLRQRRSQTIFSDEPESSYWSLSQFSSNNDQIDATVDGGVDVDDRDRRMITWITLKHGREDAIAYLPWSISYTIMVLRLFYPEQEIQYSYFVRRSETKKNIGTIIIARATVVESFKTLMSIQSFLKILHNLPHYVIPIDEKFGVIIFSDHKYVIDEIDAAIYLTSNRSENSRHFMWYETAIGSIAAIIVDKPGSKTFKLLDRNSTMYEVTVQTSSEDIFNSQMNITVVNTFSKSTDDFIRSLQYRRSLAAITDSFDYYYSTTGASFITKFPGFDSFFLGHIFRVEHYFVQVYFGRVKTNEKYDQFYNRIHSMIVRWRNGTSLQYSYHFLNNEQRREWLIYFHVSDRKISVELDQPALVSYRSFKNLYTEIPIHLIPLGDDINSNAIALYSHGRYFIGNMSDILYFRPLYGYKRRIPLDFDCKMIIEIMQTGNRDNIYFAP